MSISILLDTNTNENKTIYKPNYISYGITKVSISGFDLSYEVEEFLSNHKDIALVLPEIVEIVSKELNSRGIRSFTPKFEIMQDDETNAKYLMIIFHVKDKKYEEILELWSIISNKVREKLSENINDKISIILDGD